VASLGLKHIFNLRSILMEGIMMLDLKVRVKLGVFPENRKSCLSANSNRFFTVFKAIENVISRTESNPIFLI
jgi:hypothetical protein